MKNIVFKRIKELRIDKDFSQAYVANQLNCLQQSYSNYENGKSEIPSFIWIALADFYDVSVDYLMGRTDVKHTMR